VIASRLVGTRRDLLAYSFSVMDSLLLLCCIIGLNIISKKYFLHSTLANLRLVSERKSLYIKTFTESYSPSLEDSASKLGFNLHNAGQAVVHRRSIPLKPLLLLTLALLGICKALLFLLFGGPGPTPLIVAFAFALPYARCPSHTYGKPGKKIYSCRVFTAHPNAAENYITS
jgi:hypothetical protein